MTCLFTINGRWRALPAAVVNVLATLLVVGCSVEQPKQRCQTAPGGFALKYTKVDGSGSCADLKGDTAGVQTYWRSDSGGNINMPSVIKGGVAIKTDEVATLLTEYDQIAESKEVSAFGSFANAEPDADGFCAVTMAKPSTLKLAAVPAKPSGDAGMTDPLPAVELTLEWTNVRFYVTAAQPGTMFTARLAYKKTTDGQTCSATYDVTGLWPSVPCEGQENGPDGMPKGTGKPDETACHPCADLMSGRTTGSGINPGIDITCNADTLSCVPKGPVPSLREQPLQCKF